MCYKMKHVLDQSAEACHSTAMTTSTSYVILDDAPLLGPGVRVTQQVWKRGHKRTKQRKILYVTLIDGST